MTASGEGVAGMPATEVIDFEGLSVRLIRGGAGEGVPILLTSPWPQSVLAFRLVWNALAELGPLIAVDLPGFGRSDASALALSPSGMGSLVVRLLDHLRISRCHGVGPDVGTPALLFAAHEAPELFATITVGSGGTEMALVGDRLRGIIEGPVSDLEVGEDAAAIVQVIRSLSASEPSPEVMEDYRLSSAYGRYREAAEYIRAYPRDLPVLQGFAGEIRTPVLVISGSDDPLVPPSNGALLERLIPHCRHEILNSGHFVWEDAADEYSSLVSAWIRTGGQID